MTALIAVATLFGLIGCSTSVARMPAAAPVVNLEDIPRSHYKILSTVEGKGKRGRIFCLSFGDKQFGFSSAQAGAAVGLGNLADRRDASAAATYDAISKVPDADILMPLTSTWSRTGIACFNSETATVRGKAIKILSD